MALDRKSDSVGLDFILLSSMGRGKQPVALVKRENGSVEWTIMDNGNEYFLLKLPLISNGTS